MEARGLHHRTVTNRVSDLRDGLLAAAQPLDQLLDVLQVVLELLPVGLQPLEPLIPRRKAAAAEAEAAGSEAALTAVMRSTHRYAHLLPLFVRLLLSFDNCYQMVQTKRDQEE